MNFCGSDTFYYYYLKEIGELQCRAIDFTGKVNKTLSKR